jgi:hypothetical protein
MSNENIMRIRGRDRVGISISRTLNLGNYESIKFDISVNSDVGKEETVEAALDRVQAKAEERLANLCDPIEKALDKKAKSKKGD